MGGAVGAVVGQRVSQPSYGYAEPVGPAYVYREVHYAPPYHDHHHHGHRGHGWGHYKHGHHHYRD